MIKKFLKHLNYYLLLLIIFSIGLLATVFASPNTNLQILIIVLTIASYVFWGILHHKLNHELTNKIIVEYLLIGLLGFSIIFFIFTGGI
ncbi:MAG: hypothetical protein HY344_02570 [Candidatus Levybacteria bacterium]|nr:hypothetical protein [Candidatus Levybacteria bacterium]